MPLLWYEVLPGVGARVPLLWGEALPGVGARVPLWCEALPDVGARVPLLWCGEWLGMVGLSCQRRGRESQDCVKGFLLLSDWLWLVLA